jgi:hypothetical protein
LFGDDKVCVFCALALVGALFIFRGNNEDTTAFYSPYIDTAFNRA